MGVVNDPPLISINCPPRIKDLLNCLVQCCNDGRKVTMYIIYKPPRWLHRDLPCWNILWFGIFKSEISEFTASQLSCRHMALKYGPLSARSARSAYNELNFHNNDHDDVTDDNRRDSVSKQQPHDCLLNRLFRRRSKKTSKLPVTGLCAGNSPGTAEFPAQMASSAENVSIWWRHHVHWCSEYSNLIHVIWWFFMVF